MKKLLVSTDTCLHHLRMTKFVIPTHEPHASPVMQHETASEFCESEMLADQRASNCEKDPEIIRFDDELMYVLCIRVGMRFEIRWPLLARRTKAA